MGYRKLRKDINSRNVKPVYLFTGKEEYIMDKFVSIMKEEFIDPSLETLNYILIGKEHGFEDLFNACETLPFMSDKKIVFLKDLEEFIKQDPDNREKLNQYIEEIGDDTILILKDKSESLRKNTRLYKTINKLDGVINFDRLDNRELGNWVNNIIKSKGKTIDRNNLNYFLQRSGYLEYRSEKTLFQLENELMKIIDRSNSEEISKEDIDSNLVEDLDTNIFNLLDYINAKNTSAALGLIDEMHRANEPMPRVFFMIIRQFRLLLQYKVFRERGYNESEIRKKLKISPYEFGKISQNSRRHESKRLEEQLNFMLEMDKKQKTSSQDEKLAMELLIVKLTK